MNEAILKDLMKSVNGTTFISIDTVTEVKLAGGKKNPLQGRVQKRGVGHKVMVFQNKSVNGYEAMVQRRLTAEGKDPANFQLSPRVWGERIAGTPFVEHNGQTYLEVIFLKPGKTEMLVDGQVFNDIIDGLPAEAINAEQGGLDNKVIIRTFKIDSLKAITINKQRYEDRS